MTSARRRLHLVHRNLRDAPVRRPPTVNVRCGRRAARAVPGERARATTSHAAEHQRPDRLTFFRRACDLAVGPLGSNTARGGVFLVYEAPRSLSFRTARKARAVVREGTIVAHAKPSVRKLSQRSRNRKGSSTLPAAVALVARPVHSGNVNSAAGLSNHRVGASMGGGAWRKRRRVL